MHYKIKQHLLVLAFFKTLRGVMVYTIRPNIRQWCAFAFVKLSEYEGEMVTTDELLTFGKALCQTWR